jgi:hypothetical protein
MSAARWIWTEGDGWLWKADDEPDGRGTVEVNVLQPAATWTKLLDPFGRELMLRVKREIGFGAR